MKVSYDEGVANHVGPESCGIARKGTLEALTGEDPGRVLSLDNVILWSADAILSGGRQQRSVRHREDQSRSRGRKRDRSSFVSPVN
jgi:hypothetical protein